MTKLSKSLVSGAHSKKTKRMDFPKKQHRDWTKSIGSFTGEMSWSKSLKKQGPFIRRPKWLPKKA